ncbi:protein timeless homolog isoform X2 [Ceratina calcarata]|uniref:Protein timeless homolog isoform X2 n=1 Tax=Ceratina calcarata TaxID=156304 RepID=A0AAJ7JH75_9HYME|nr:protein timeless homolog isoform X2 [Ceratina calcarata]
MTDYLSTELAATCAALGYYDGSKYHLDKHCLDVIKDLIKYLRRDDDSHVVRQFLGQTKVLQTDLIKIFIDHPDKIELWEVLLRLIINITSPVFLIYNEQIPTDKMQHSIYQKLIACTQAYKVALTDERIWAVLSNKLSEILKIEIAERGEEKELIIERILIFIRNILQIPPDENEKRVDNDVTVHDQVLFALNASGLVDLLLFIASNRNEQQYHMQILEIVSLMLRDQNASQLAKSGLQRSITEKEKDEAILLAARIKEKEVKMEKIRKFAGARHSHFGGTYVVQNMKAIGDNQLLCHKPYQKIEALNFGQVKNKMAKPKNKRPLADPRGERTSALSVRLFLKEFCVEFLNAAYNPVMKHARSCIIAAAQGEQIETTCYLWAMRFFMEFNRNYKFEVKYVSETISTETFHMVQRQMDFYYEMIITDKKKIPLWSRRLHIALKAYQELLHTLMAMDLSTDRGVKESSRVIKSNVFYVPEYRETILSLILSFDSVKMSRQYLIDLVTTVHIFLKMLNNFCGKDKRNILVQEVKRKPAKRKNANKKNAVQKEQSAARSLDERWDEISPQLSIVMQQGTIPVVVPFDATLDVPIDDQKVEAMRRIQKLLRSKFLEEAIGLIRAARDVWPENDSFGRVDIAPEEEFLVLREIFFADLGVVEEEPVSQNDKENIENLLNSVPEEDNDEDEDEEEDSEPRVVAHETDFKFADFVHRFANVKVVKALLILLQQFDKNTNEVNHYVVKLLHRIAWDCKMPGMMFQASMFRVFQRILESKYPSHKDLQKFAVFIIRRFIEVAEKNRKAYMELLFWKTCRDATEVVEGYNAETDNKKVSRGLWTETQEDELRTLFMEHQTNNYPQDVIDWILDHINQERTRRSIIKKLKELCLIVNSKAVRNEIQKRLPKEWSEEEMDQLKELWEQLKDDDDPVELIFNGLTIKRPKAKIKEKLLELGLATDRKQLRKKRSRKSNHEGKSSWETQSVSNSDEDESSDEEAGKSSGNKNKTSNKPAKKGTMEKKNARKRPAMVYTDAQLSGLLKDVIEKNLGEALEWLKESLEDVLEDRDEESSEGIPLVPVTDYSSAAMDSPSFQRLIRAMGLTPPADEQESYWRIPTDMVNPMIRKRCILIESALAGNFTVEEPKATTSKDSEGDGNNESDDEDVLENVKKFFSSKAEPSTSRDSDSEAGVSSTPVSSRSIKTPSIEHVNTEMQETGTEDSETVDTPKSDDGKYAKRISRLVDSSDSEIETETNVKSAQDEGKRHRSEDGSDKEDGTTKKRRLLDSDEEKEPLTSQDTELKHSRMIISDDEEEPAQEQRNQQRSSRVIISDDED